ncbi:ferric reduction oxidase 2-like [Iris pallida]|uniref:ferric-chelate reductase (NADH) n=1 Tax=Iris pallida TaxID=29817 RepID=A0AAX6EKK8_IRIPA|nr:ferric reduction oxidase 2-like [Iris pallida]
MSRRGYIAAADHTLACPLLSRPLPIHRSIRSRCKFTTESVAEMAVSSSSPLAAIRLLIGIVFLGWLLVWIMMPTNTYRNIWIKKVRTHTNSTYFGRQGTNLLIYAFPILFISVLGCFYSHIMLQTSESRKTGKYSRRRRRSEVWRRPVIVKGPLGIVSAVELALSLMFLALLLWYLSMYLRNGFARITPEVAKENGEKVWQSKLESAGLRLGLAGNLCLAFLFFPVTRGSSILSLAGLTSEGSIRYHIWLGHIVMILLTAHGLCYFVYWGSTNNSSKMLEWATDHISNVAGEISLASGLVLWATTFPRVRRMMFELFFYTHHLYVVFLVFYLLHVGIPFFSLILPGVYLFMVDRYLRFLQSRRNVRLISARLLPSETVELNFSKSPGLGYTPMSNVFINVPSISSLQWHPFTVSSSSNLEPEKLSVIIKKEGKWTQKLYQELINPSLENLNVSVEGPYGPVSVDYERHDTLVMVSGGSGIAPFISIIRDIIHRSTTGSATPKIVLVSMFKTSADLTMLDLLLPLSGKVSDLSGLKLRIEAYVTREKAPGSEARKQIRNVWFKPNPSAVPLAPVLGPNSWLWLAAVITSSFVAYLLLICILTRFYIYPIEQRGATYSYTWRALLHLLFLCTCIAAVSGAAVLWNKKQSGMEAKQIHIVDNSTSRSRLSSCFDDGSDRELESVPHGSLVQATTVHFGGRPDLKKILLEINGSSIGAMVSGPSGLRRDVASICSSGLGNSLHFESISFSW